MSADRPTGGDQRLSKSEQDEVDDALGGHLCTAFHGGSETMCRACLDQHRELREDAYRTVERILVARADKDAAATGAGWFWTQDEWAEWSNDLATLIPEDDVSRYANPDGAQESIIEDCLRAYVAERGKDAAAIAAVRAVIDDPNFDRRQHATHLATKIRAALDVAPPTADPWAGCPCPPCPGRGNDGHGMTHCAECCMGTLVEADPACPIHGDPTLIDPPTADHRPNGCCDYHRHIADGCCHCEHAESPTADHDTMRREAWEEGVDAAFRGAIMRQNADDVKCRNPYRADAVAQPDGGGARD